MRVSYFWKIGKKKDNIKIIFLPSPSTSYNWIDPINYYPRYSKGELDYKTVTIAENEKSSSYLRKKIKSFSEINNIAFLDLTQKIQEKTKINVLHGPTDWIHFNASGYEFIAKNL